MCLLLGGHGFLQTRTTIILVLNKMNTLVACETLDIWAHWPSELADASDSTLHESRSVEEHRMVAVHDRAEQAAA